MQWSWRRSDGNILSVTLHQDSLVWAWIVGPPPGEPAGHTQPLGDFLQHGLTHVPATWQGISQEMLAGLRQRALSNYRQSVAHAPTQIAMPSKHGTQVVQPSLHTEAPLPPKHGTQLMSKVPATGSLPPSAAAPPSGSIDEQVVALHRSGDTQGAIDLYRAHHSCTPAIAREEIEYLLYKLPKPGG